MKIKLKSMITILLLTLMAGCKEDCPAFPAQLVDYFPYTEGDVLVFGNSEGETLSFKVDYVVISKANKISCTCDCSFDSFFKTDKDPLTGLYMNGSISGWDNKVNMVFFIANSYGYCDTFGVQKDNFNRHSPESGYIFGNSLILENEETYITDKVVIVKGEGIVEFYDVIKDCTWKKVNH